MKLLSKNEESCIRTAVELAFKGCDFDFVDDKGGSSIVFVQLNGVPPSEKDRAQKILENILSTFKMRAELLPRIICADTEQTPSKTF